MGMQRLLLLLLPFAHASTLASLAHSRIQRGCSPAAASATRRPLASAASVVSPKDNAIHGYLSRGLRPLVRRSQRGRTTTAAISRVGAGAAAAAASSTVATAATASADAAAKATTAGTAVYDREFPQVVDEQMTMEQNAFPIKPDELIRKAKVFFSQTFKDWGPDTLSEDFVFMGPVVGPLSKEQFINAVTGFDFLTAFPDNNAQYYHFRVDPFEPNRVWTTQRGVATHTGVMAGRFKPTGKRIETPPQALSLKFNERGQVEQMTVGYVMDRSVGNTGGLGGIFGYLYAIGSPLPFPEGRPWSMSWQYRFFNFLGRLAGAVSKFFARFSKQ